MNKVEEVNYRIAAIEALQILKKSLSYRELAAMMDLSPTVLSRYVNGHVIPSLEKARKIFELYKREYIVKTVKRRIFRDEVGAVDTSGIISDSILLKGIILSEYNKFRGFKIDKVLTMEADGIPVAVQFGLIFGVDLAVARKSKKVGVRNFIEIKQVFESGAYRYIYLPKGALNKNEYVLIVDDIIRTGATIRALAKLCKIAKANISGVFSIISIGSSAEKLKEELMCPVESFITL
ncbi:adenine phosphoribosyltransferase [Candidatus Geothermarchaeota archaeon]|nr:MAG: adenine phosphoribosyltransferase [Candidatus Geothermarchaeota archaeon]